MITPSLSKSGLHLLGIVLSFSLFLALASCGDDATGPQKNPVPEITNISPSPIPAGGVTEVMLTITGKNFLEESEVVSSLTPQTTTFVSDTELTCEYDWGTPLNPGYTMSIQVVNPPPGGGTSNSVLFHVGNPVPVVSSVSPEAWPVGEAFELNVYGSDFLESSVIRWNGEDTPTTFLHKHQLKTQISETALELGTIDSVHVFTPGPAGGASDKVTVTPYIRIDLHAHESVYDSFRDRVYVAVGQDDPLYPGALVALDPGNGAVLSTLTVFENPRWSWFQVALSDDGEYLYMADTTVVCIALDTFTIESEFSLAATEGFWLNAADMVVLPGSPRKLVVSRSHGNDYYDTVVYENGVALPNTISDTRDFGFPCIDALTASSSAGIVYGYEGCDVSRSNHSFYVMSVDDQGIYLDEEIDGLISGFDVVYEDGLVYCEDGAILDPVNLTVVGSLPVELYSVERILPVSSVRRIFYGLQVFDMDTLELLLEIDFSQGAPMPQKPAHDGRGGELVHYRNDHLMIVGGNTFVILARHPLYGSGS